MEKPFFFSFFSFSFSLFSFFYFFFHVLVLQGGGVVGNLGVGASRSAGWERICLPKCVEYRILTGILVPRGFGQLGNL